MELLDAAKALAAFPTRFVLRQTVIQRDPTLLERYIRALEDYIDALHRLDDILGATLHTVAREKQQLSRHCDILRQNIRTFEAEGNTDLAMMARHRLTAFQQLKASYDRLSRQQEQERDTYRTIRLQLEATLSETRRYQDDIQDGFEEGRTSEALLQTLGLKGNEAWDEEHLSKMLRQLLSPEPEPL